MEYVEGESLKERLARGPLPLEETLRLAAQIAEALEESHSRHIIHRDFKPANVMLSRTGHVKVMDFGLAKRLLSTEKETTEEQTLTELTEMGTTIGTLAYMSPEQLQGQPVNHSADIFSFGAVLYEMLTRKHPFRKSVGMATAAAILTKEPAPLAQRALGLPQRLEKLVAETLAKTPAERPQSMHTIHEQLKGILLEVQAPPEASGVLNLRKLARNLRRPRIAIPAAAFFIALVSLTIWFFNRQAEVHWAREEALPQIERMIEENDAWRNLVPPYRLAEQAEAILGDDPKLTELFSQVSLEIDVQTEPASARVYMKEYENPDGEWSYLGVSPLEKVRVPIGIFRWKFEKEGYETVLAAASTWDIGGGDDLISGYDLVRTLDEEGSGPPGMVRVQGTETDVGTLGDFFIDRYEVTNREYKKFVDAGGYRKREYWKHSFVKDGRELTWEEAMMELLDQSGQPGPSTWLAGDYPQDQDGYPVSGLSWYEAAAYAEYAGKSLPTNAHWNAARGGFTPMIQWPQLGGFALLAPFTNFGGRGPVPAGSLQGITAYGAFDMAGNVREWCWNETPQGRLIRGGSWNDNTYEFVNQRQAPPMDRSARNGFRLAVYTDPRTVPEAAFDSQRLGQPVDFRAQQPASDAVFEVYREQFSYDETELNARVEHREESAGGWIREKVSFDAAYGGERVLAYLFLPTNTLPPYQTVVYFPGAASSMMASSQDLESYYEFSMFLSFLVRNGRAVLYPVYKGTFERGSPALMVLSEGAESHAYTEFIVQVVKDFRRSVDYLETRPDIDSGRLAYYGMSWGGCLGAIIPAVEERLGTNILLAGGFYGPARPEALHLNYVTRVRTPTLMLNGRYDNILDIEEQVKPMFDMLGTPAEHKQLILYDTDHIPPRTEYIKEMLAWLDRYLGPVK